MPTNREVHQFLSGKMKFIKTEGSHSKYVLPRKLSRTLPIMLPFHLQHGRNDVANHILRQIEKTLGISSSELSDAIACDYSDMVLYMSLLTTALIRLLDGCPLLPRRYNPEFRRRRPPTDLRKRLDLGCSRQKKLRAHEATMIGRLITLLDEQQAANRVEPQRVGKKAKDAITSLIAAKRTLLDA